jgi:hypothetical protein
LARVRQEQGPSLADRLLAIGKDCAARLKPIMATCFMTNAVVDTPVRRSNSGETNWCRIPTTTFDCRLKN